MLKPVCWKDTAYQGPIYFCARTARGSKQKKSGRLFTASQPKFENSKMEKRNSSFSQNEFSTQTKSSVKSTRKTRKDRNDGSSYIIQECLLDHPLNILRRFGFGIDRIWTNQSLQRRTPSSCLRAFYWSNHMAYYGWGRTSFSCRSSAYQHRFVQGLPPKTPKPQNPKTPQSKKIVLI